MTGCDTLGYAQALVNTLADTIPEIQEQSVSDTWGSAQALVYALADTRGGGADNCRHTGRCAGTERPAGSLGDTLGNAQALVDTLADTVEEMEEL